MLSQNLHALGKRRSCTNINRGQPSSGVPFGSCANLILRGEGARRKYLENPRCGCLTTQLFHFWLKTLTGPRYAKLFADDDSEIWAPGCTKKMHPGFLRPFQSIWLMPSIIMEHPGRFWCIFRSKTQHMLCGTAMVNSGNKRTHERSQRTDNKTKCIFSFNLWTTHVSDWFITTNRQIISDKVSQFTWSDEPLRGLGVFACFCQKIV